MSNILNEIQQSHKTLHQRIEELPPNIPGRLDVEPSIEQRTAMAQAIWDEAMEKIGPKGLGMGLCVPGLNGGWIALNHPATDCQLSIAPDCDFVKMPDPPSPVLTFEEHREPREDELINEGDVEFNAASTMKLGLHEDPIVSPLERELTSLLNAHSCENSSNTPDFILSQYMLDCLSAFNKASRRREDWYGRSLTIGGT